MSLTLTGAGAGSDASAAPPVAKVQTFTKAGSASVSPETIPITATTTAGNYMIVLVGLSGGHVVSSITDSKGNTYTIHDAGGNSSFDGFSSASAKITTPLVNGDTITITPNVASFIGAVATEYSGLDPTTALRTKSSEVALSTAAADGGTTAGNATAGDLVIGFWVGNNAFNIATPGAGYTDETGVSTTGTVITIDWESKVAAGGSTERAQATWSGIANGLGITLVFAKAP